MQGDSKGLTTDDAATTARNLENTVFDAKCVVGQKFDDPIVQADIKQWPCRVIPRPGNKAKHAQGPKEAKPKAKVRLRFVGWPDD